VDVKGWGVFVGVMVGCRWVVEMVQQELRKRESTSFMSKVGNRLPKKKLLLWKLIP